MNRQGAELDFWSRRKAAVRAEAKQEHVAPPIVEEVATVEAETRSDADVLSDLGLPDPDVMKMGDDFSAFMKGAVPAHLRKRALRQLWRSNPVLANLDGLLDHGEDFTDAATVMPGMQSAYQIGRGMMRHVEALAEAEEKALAEAEGAPEDDLILAEDTAQDEPALDTAGPEVDEAAADIATVQTAPVRRHMRFDFGLTPEEGCV